MWKPRCCIWSICIWIWPEVYHIQSGGTWNQRWSWSWTKAEINNEELVSIFVLPSWSWNLKSLVHFLHCLFMFNNIDCDFLHCLLMFNNIDCDFLHCLLMFNHGAAFVPQTHNYTAYIKLFDGMIKGVAISWNNDSW